MDRATFAAKRDETLTRVEDELRPVVRDSLRFYGREGWWEPIVAAALGQWDEFVKEEFPGNARAVAVMRRAFAEVVRDAMKEVQRPYDVEMDATVNLLSRWLATYTTNHATYSAATADPETLTLEWVSMNDEDVRVSHREADGQVIPVGGTFTVGGHGLHFPGEPVGPPEVWINCRCVARIGREGDIMEPLTDEEVTALTAAAESDEVDAEAPTLPDDFDMGPMPWHGVLTVEGTPTGDKRMFTPESLTWADLPLPLRWQKVDAPGHDGAVITGRIDNIWRDGPLIKAEGIFDSSEEALASIDLIGQDMLRGVSVDVDSAVMELQNDDGTPFDIEGADINDSPTQVFTEGRIRSAAMCSVPAFAEAFIALGPWGDVPEINDEEVEGETEETEESVAAAAQTDGQFAPGTRDGPGWITHPRATQRITNYWVRGPGAAKIGWGAPNDFYRCRRQLSKYVQNPEWLNGLCANLHKRALGIWPGEHDGPMGNAGEAEAMSLDCVDCLDSMVAAGGQVFPHEWFLDPNLDGPTRFTVTDDGRVFGHLAVKGVCHIGFEDICMDVPASLTDYNDFHQSGFITTDEGDLAIGKVTMNTGHAPMRGSATAAMAHYDNTGTAAAYVRAGEDQWGVWIAGVVDPYLSEKDRFHLKAAGVSGDWRRDPAVNNIELRAALAVNVPGFPIPATAVAASGGRQTALVAAGVVIHENGERPGDVTVVVRETLAAIRAEEKAEADRKARAERAAATKRTFRAKAVKAKKVV